MSSTQDTTTAECSVASPRDAVDVQPFLFLAFECEQPLSTPVRHRLDVDAVRIGRGDRNAVRASDGGERVLSLGVPDRWMSVVHAQLKSAAGAWVLDDLGSKNGTVINGKRVERAELADGDLIELGHTFFSFRMLAADEGLAASAEPDPHSTEAFATLNPHLAAELRDVEAVARSAVPIVLLGETGTGKELLARAIHRLSGRSGPLQAVNCGALPDHLAESELFGYRKGAFSGATEDRLGLIRSADRGTLFLDEIGDLPASAQAVLLRVLQESEVQPLGATRPVKIDLRVFSATHRDLDAMVAQGRFRADLLARLSGFFLRLPPLRERREDLGIMIATILRRHFPDRAPAVRFAPAAARALLTYRWPLNVRELEKCMESSVILAGGGPVDLRHLPPAVREWRGAVAAAAPLPPETQRRCEEIKTLLREHGGNITAVASAMKKARAQLQRWIKRCRIDVREFKR